MWNDEVFILKWFENLEIGRLCVTQWISFHAKCQWRCGTIGAALSGCRGSRGCASLPPGSETQRVVFASCSFHASAHPHSSLPHSPAGRQEEVSRRRTRYRKLSPSYSNYLLCCSWAASTVLEWLYLHAVSLSWDAVVSQQRPIQRREITSHGRSTLWQHRNTPTKRSRQSSSSPLFRKSENFWGGVLPWLIRSWLCHADHGIQSRIPEISAQVCCAIRRFLT